MEFSLVTILIFFKVRNNRFSFWILEVKHVFLILIILFDTLRLESVLLTNIFSILSMLLRLLLHLFKVFSLLSSLSFNTFVFLNTWDISFWILLFVGEGMSSWFKGTNTEFIFTRAFKRLILYNLRLRLDFFRIFNILSCQIFLKIRRIWILDNNVSTNRQLLIINVKLVLQVLYLVVANITLNWLNHLIIVWVCHLWLLSGVVQALVCSICWVTLFVGKLCILNMLLLDFQLVGVQLDWLSGLLLIL